MAESKSAVSHQHSCRHGGATAKEISTKWYRALGALGSFAAHIAAEAAGDAQVPWHYRFLRREDANGITRWRRGRAALGFRRKSLQPNVEQNGLVPWLSTTLASATNLAEWRSARRRVTAEIRALRNHRFA
jgi:hypothetical protein